MTDLETELLGVLEEMMATEKRRYHPNEIYAQELFRENNAKALAVIEKAKTSVKRSKDNQDG